MDNLERQLEGLDSFKQRLHKTGNISGCGSDKGRGRSGGALGISLGPSTATDRYGYLSR